MIDHLKSVAIYSMRNLNKPRVRKGRRNKADFFCNKESIYI